MSLEKGTSKEMKKEKIGGKKTNEARYKYENSLPQGGFRS